MDDTDDAKAFFFLTNPKNPPRPRVAKGGPWGQFYWRCLWGLHSGSPTSALHGSCLEHMRDIEDGSKIVFSPFPLPSGNLT